MPSRPAALSPHQLSRVLIVDWDVHHGNGTQDVLGRVRVNSSASTVRARLLPGTGAADETGTGPGLGFTKNVR